MSGIEGRRHKQLLDDLKEMAGYCKLKEEALDRTVWRTRFGRGCGHVVRRTAGWMSSYTSTSTNEIWRKHVACLAGDTWTTNHSTDDRVLDPGGLVKGSVSFPTFLREIREQPSYQPLCLSKWLTLQGIFGQVNTVRGCSSDQRNFIFVELVWLYLRCGTLFLFVVSC